MRRVLIIFTVLLLTNLPGFAQNDMKAIVTAANQKFMDVFTKGATSMADFYTSDAKLLFANNDVIQGTSTISTFWENVYKSGVKRMKLDTVDARQEGNMIVEEGRYAMYGDNDTQLDRGKYIVLWKQENGVWKLYRDIGNTSIPASMGTK